MFADRIIIRGKIVSIQKWLEYFHIIKWKNTDNLSHHTANIAFRKSVQQNV